MLSCCYVDVARDWFVVCGDIYRVVASNPSPMEYIAIFNLYTFSC